MGHNEPDCIEPIDLNSPQHVTPKKEKRPSIASPNDSKITSFFSRNDDVKLEKKEKNLNEDKQDDIAHAKKRNLDGAYDGTSRKLLKTVAG